MSESPANFWSRLRQERFLIVGALGQTGLAAARLFRRMGVPFRISDSSSAPQTPDVLKPLGLKGSDIYLGPQHEAQLSGITQILLSPGVPRSSSMLGAARARRIPIWCDFDLLYPIYAHKKIAAVTGTDGKTTTTTLLSHLLADTSKVVLAGNLGCPICDEYDNLVDCDTVVLELSSFMLEDLKLFRANTSTVTNIAEDHVDRYASLTEYAETKRAILRFAQAGDHFVQNIDDPIVASWTLSHLNVDTASANGAADCSLVNGVLEVGAARLHPSELRVRGNHLHFDVLLAACMAQALGIPQDHVLLRAKSFAGVPHRFETVGRWRDVVVIDDSKATSVQAVCAALASVHHRPVVLIVGGQDKALDPAPLLSHEGSLRAVIGYGHAGRRLIRCFQNTEAHYEARFSDAVTLACKMAQAGDTLLLSPACTSFDQHRDYRERGAEFRSICRRLLREQ